MGTMQRLGIPARSRCSLARPARRCSRAAARAPRRCRSAAPAAGGHGHEHRARAPPRHATTGTRPRRARDGGTSAPARARARRPSRRSPQRQDARKRLQRRCRRARARARATRPTTPPTTTANQTLRVLIGTRTGSSRRLRPAGLLLRRRPLHRHRREGTERDASAWSARATPKSRSPTRCTAGATRSAPERRAGEGALPAERRPTRSRSTRSRRRAPRAGSAASRRDCAGSQRRCSALSWVARRRTRSQRGSSR